MRDYDVHVSIRVYKALLNAALDRYLLLMREGQHCSHVYAFVLEIN